MGSIRLKGALVLVLLLVLSGAVRCLQKYGIQDSCGRTIEIGSTWQGKASSGILIPRMYTTYSENSECSVVLKSLLSAAGMVVSIRKLDLRPNRVDTLKIQFKNNFGIKEEKLQNIFPYRNKEDYLDEYKSYVSSTNVTITFSAGSSGFRPILYDGFELIFTATSKTPCSHNEFRCSSGGICIAEDLRCDGHNHCGDLSDQWKCGASVGTIVGSVFGTIFLIVALISCCLIIKKRRNRRGVTTTVITNPAPTTCVPPPNTYEPPPPNTYEPPPPYVPYTAQPPYPNYSSTYVGQSAAPTAPTFKS